MLSCLDLSRHSVVGLFVILSPKSGGTGPDFSEVKVPEAFLVSAGRALFSDSGSDGTASISFAQGQLRSLCVPSEEGSAGVAGDPAVVTACFAQPLVTHLADNVVLCVRHLTERRSYKYAAPIFTQDY